MLVFPQEVAVVFSVVVASLSFYYFNLQSDPALISRSYLTDQNFWRSAELAHRCFKRSIFVLLLLLALKVGNKSDARMNILCGNSNEKVIPCFLF
jgi:hypothetical protein